MAATQPIDLGDLIASRKLYFIEPGMVNREVTINIGKPRPFPDSPDNYYCPFQILGIGPERTLFAAGVDAVQALQLVMKMIGAYLHTLNQECGGNLRWEGAEGEDLGFPTLPK